MIDEVRHGADDLLGGAAGVVLVDKHEVDVVHLQVPERLLHRLDDLFAGERPVRVSARRDFTSLRALPFEFEIIAAPVLCWSSSYCNQRLLLTSPSRPSCR